MVMNLISSSPVVGNSYQNGYTQKMMGSVPQSYLNRYGCEDCFRDKPYVYEFPKPYIPKEPAFARPGLLQRIIAKIFS